MTSKLDVVAMATPAGFEDRDVLVLASLELAHSSIVLHPNTDVFELQIAHLPRGKQFAEMPPVHAGKKNCAIHAVMCERREHKSQKGCVLGCAHLARGHGKFAMVNGAEAARMTIDGHVVGRIDEHHAGLRAVHQVLECMQLKCITTEKSVPAQLPRIAQRAYGTLTDRFRNLIGGAGIVVGSGRQALNSQVDFRDGKASNLETEVEVQRG